ncbi:uncharacterized protein LOC132696671 isoform X3 [Cylas formicarius]|uniref:uncharacterized protein LOC132696671 isoform X3 n=1 Tax=Cylas formicarius TaxID=197179 RepID=UPI002958D1D4|nr:uncharacterized protein LOC132696671 isoform X3 [Cylas formicarius]
MDDESLPVVVNGGYRCDNGSIYVGSWNNEGKRHGNGHLLLADGTRYDGYFQDGLYNGLGVLTFTDGAKFVLIFLISKASIAKNLLYFLLYTSHMRESFSKDGFTGMAFSGEAMVCDTRENLEEGKFGD